MQETILIIGDEDCEEKYRKLTLLQEKLAPQRIACCAFTEAQERIHSKDIRLTAAVIALNGHGEQAYLGLIGLLRSVSAELPIILLLHYGDEAFAQKALRLGVHDFLIRPVTVEKLCLTLQHAISIRHMRTYIDRLERHITLQSSITPEERHGITLGQMHHFLVDESGNIKPLRILEQEIIASVLRHNNGCVARAARSLGIGRSTLYRKVEWMKEPVYTARENQITLPTTSTSPALRSSGK
jgi:DNA-binding NtrC family response regulator